MKEPIGVKAWEKRVKGKSKIYTEIFSRKKLSKEKLRRLRRRLERALGVNEDVRPFYKKAKMHPVLKQLVRRLCGLREGFGNDIFHSLTLAVLLQMAPVKRSEMMWDCLIRRYGEKIRFDGRIIRCWPTEVRIARESPRALASRCKLGYRAKSLVRIAKELVRGFPSLEELAVMSPDEAMKKLMELYGVGEYSAGFATPHPSFSLDVWSVKIFHKIIFGKPAPAKNPRSVIEKTAAAAKKIFGPYHHYVFLYVLNDLEYLEKKFHIQE